MSIIQLLLFANLCTLIYHTISCEKNFGTSNRGGPWDNNFGMINLLKNISGSVKINDYDNNNNINLSTMNNSNCTIIYNITIVNNN